MCTAIVDSHLFGRTLDLEASYGEEIAISGRNFQFEFIHEKKSRRHFAIIGTAHVSNGIPLYYDAVNEMGLCAAALRFSDLTVYRRPMENRLNLASFEVIPWILCNFGSTNEALVAINSLNVTFDDISPALPSTPLHWIVADTKSAFVIESVADGVKIYENKLGVMTNAPDFPTQSAALKNSNPNRLLGDGSSTSRFVRAHYAKANAMRDADSTSAISHFFHVMSSVSLPYGYSRGIGGKPMKTLYTSCIDMKDLIYYFTTYSCRQIHGVRLSAFEPESDKLITLPMPHKEKISYID